MKNNYIFLLFLCLTTMMVGQNKDFVPTDGVTWSNPANWTPAGVPDVSNNVRLVGTIESDLDLNLTLSRVQTVFGTGNGGGTETIIGGAGVLTIDTQVQANVNKGVNNLSGNGVNLIFKGSVIINNTAGGFGNTLMAFGNTATNQITFDDGSTLTINTPLEVRSLAGGGGTYNFNGAITGAGVLRFAANGDVVFGATSDNSARTGDFVYVGANAVVTVNTADNNVFVPSGQKLQSNADNGSVIVNGANVYNGSFGVDASRTFTFDVNANQNSMENITFTGSASGTLNIDVDNSVTELFFADNSGNDWGSGSVNITGFQDGVLRFGTDANGLTAAQLSQITANGSADPLALDSNGFLIFESSLSVDDFLSEDTLTTIAYPTTVENVLFFKRPKDHVVIYDLNGREIISNHERGQTQIELSGLRQGLYMVVFDNSITEKFVKK